MAKSIFPTFAYKKERLADCNTNGILVYGMKNYVVTCDISGEFLLTVMRREAHDRVNCVSFNKIRPNILATSGTEGKFQIWNSSNQGLETYLVVEGFESLTSLEWSNDLWNVIFISHGNCTLTKFNIATHQKDEITCVNENEKITIMSSNSDFLACGCENGVIAVIDVHTFQLHKRFEAHHGQITDMSWSPNSQKLLSCSVDNTLKVWSFQDENISGIKCYAYPTGLCTWPTAIWHPVKNDYILTAAAGGLLAELDSSLGENAKLDIFAHHMRPGNKEISSLILNKATKNIVVALSKDRMITLWNLDLKTSFAENFTNTSPVKQLAFPPLSSGLSRILAVITSAPHMLFWDTASTSLKCKTFVVYQNITSNVSCMAWHPEDRGAIAFGTDDGKVGFVRNIMRNHNKPNYYELEHKGKIVNICWGLWPLHKDKDSPNRKEWVVFSCGEGAIHIHSQKRSANIMELIKFKLKKYFTFVSWKDDYSLFALGNGDGCVQIMDGNSYEELLEIPVTSSTITFLAWHPSSYLQEKQILPSTMHSWLAVLPGKDTKGFLPFALYDIEKKLVNGTTTANVRKSIILSAFTSEIVSLTWSPHNEVHLATCGFDHCVIVWDIVTCTPLFHYRDHAFTVTSVAFDLFDRDLVHSGSLDFSVRCWRQSEQCLLPQFKKTKIKNKEETKKDPSSSAGEEAEGDEGTAQKVEITTATTKTSTLFENKKCQLSFVSPQFNALSAEERALEIQKLGNYIAQKKNGEEVPTKLGENELALLGWLGDKEDMERAILSTKLNNECLKRNLRYAAVWEKDLTDVVQHAIENESITDELMSVIPCEGREAWKKLCFAYAKQLEKNGYYLKAAIYLYACRKTAECFQLLKNKVSAKVALSLAKLLFLHENDPLIKELTMNAMQEYVAEGNVGALAKYFLNKGNIVQAAVVFGLKNLAKYDKAAAYMCLKAGHAKEAKLHAMQCLKNGLLKCDWKIVREMMEEQPYMKNVSWIVTCHEMFVNCATDLKASISADPSQYGMQHIKSDDSEAALGYWKSYSVKEKSCLSYLYHAIHDDIQLCLKEMSLQDLSSIFVVLMENKCSETTEFQIYVPIVIFICKFFVHLTINSGDLDSSQFTNNAFKCLEDASGACAKDDYMLHIICLLLFPFDLHLDSNSVMTVRSPLILVEEQNAVDKVYNELKRQWESQLLKMDMDFSIFSQHPVEVMEVFKSTDVNDHATILLSIFIANFFKQSKH